jgi:hypothetical protein
MSRRLSLSAVLLAAVAAGAFVAGRASSDEPPAPPAGGMPPGFAEKMKEWEKLKKPGPQHELLKTFVGSWVGTGTWTEEGMTSKFTETATGVMVFGDRFLRVGSRMTTEAAPPIPAMSMESLMFVGFDNAKQKYVQSMVGDWSTSLGTSEGSYDAATKTLTMSGVEIMGEGKERKFRMQQRIVSNDEWTFTMWMTQPDGKEAKVGEAVYKRK